MLETGYIIVTAINTILLIVLYYMFLTKKENIERKVIKNSRALYNVEYDNKNYRKDIDEVVNAIKKGGSVINNLDLLLFIKEFKNVCVDDLIEYINSFTIAKVLECDKNSYILVDIKGEKTKYFIDTYSCFYRGLIICDAIYFEVINNDKKK